MSKRTPLFWFKFVSLLMLGLSFSARVVKAQELLQPKFSLRNSTFDFGTVEEGKKVETQFTVANDGTAPLEVTRIQPACGCTAAVIGEGALAPGEERPLTVALDTSGFNGPKVKTIRIFTNDPVNPSLTVTLRGSVRQLVTVTPPRVFFGPVAAKSNPVRSFFVAASEKSGIEIRAVEPKSSLLRVDAVDGFEGGIAGKKVSVMLSPLAPHGVLNDRINILTNSKRLPTIVVPVFAKIEGAVALQPSEVSFGLQEAPLTKDLQGQATLVNRSSTPLSFVNVESDSSAVTASVVPVEPGNRFTIVVTVNSGYSGSLRARIKISTDAADPDDREIYLPVYAIVAPKGE